MEMGNQTAVTTFRLLGFLNHPEFQMVFFLVFSVIYMVTLMGNVMIITVTTADIRLHTSMYFLVANLSFIDLCCMLTIIPKILVNFLQEIKTTSYAGCKAQMFSLIVLGQCVLLAAMAYDRYIAICHPLLYTVIMNRSLSPAGSWILGMRFSELTLPQSPDICFILLWTQ